MAETGRDTGDIDVMSHGWNALFDMDMMGTYTDLTGLLSNAEGKFSEINGLDSEGYARHIGVSNRVSRMIRPRLRRPIGRPTPRNSGSTTKMAALAPRFSKTLSATCQA